jgi:hypothetical protein
MSTLEEIEEKLKKMLYLGKKIINLDEFKPLFLNALKLHYEVGFNMFYNTGLINFEVTKGINKFVTIPYNVAIGIHTHPKYLYKSEYIAERIRLKGYKPPSHTDYIQSIYDFIKTKSINIIIENSGMWIYGPNKELIEEVYRVQPDIPDILAEEIKEGELDKEINVGDQLYHLIDILGYNANNEHQNLILNKNIVISIIINHILKEPPTEEFIKELEREDMDALIKRYNIQKEKISIKEYITRIEDLVGGDDIGFNVRYIPWEEPFEFIVNITDEYLDIFKQIKDRGLNIFDETDKDIILEIANKTEQGRILRKI